MRADRLPQFSLELALRTKDPADICDYLREQNQALVEALREIATMLNVMSIKPQKITLAQSETYDVTSVTAVFISDGNASALFLVGNLTTVYISGTSGLFVTGTSPGAGTIGVGYASGTMRVTNNSGISKTLTLVVVTSLAPAP